jgi:3'(2'), 5'-bisphosphate nucleotidase
MGQLVRDLGHEMLGWRGTNKIDGKWEGTQLKTAADFAAHAYLSERLTKLEPNIPVVSEEDEASKLSVRPDRYWLIDPIDGTASFAHGFDGFVTQVALMEAGQPVLAAIFAPVFDQLYLARRGGGATVNGRSLKLNPDPARKVLIDNYPSATGIAAALFEALQCTDYVECGSIALKICRVADGTADIFCKDVPVRDWDIAAPSLILGEAGGWLECPDGTPYVFDNHWEKAGIVATHSSVMAQTVTHWIRQRTSRSVPDGVKA